MKTYDFVVELRMPEHTVDDTKLCVAKVYSKDVDNHAEARHKVVKYFKENGGWEVERIEKADTLYLEPNVIS